MEVRSHYSKAQSAEQLKKYCEFFNERLKYVKIDIKESLIFYSGFSGIASAHALQHFFYDKENIQLNMIMLRKKEDIVHRNTKRYCEANIHDVLPTTEIKNFIFIDDFISIGNTFKYCLNRIKKLGYKVNKTNLFLSMSGSKLGFGMDVTHKYGCDYLFPATEIKVLTYFFSEEALKRVEKNLSPFWKNKK